MSITFVFKCKSKYFYEILKPFSIQQHVMKQIHAFDSFTIQIFENPRWFWYKKRFSEMPSRPLPSFYLFVMVCWTETLYFVDKSRVVASRLLADWSAARPDKQTDTVRKLREMAWRLTVTSHGSFNITLCSNKAYGYQYNNANIFTVITVSSIYHSKGNILF